MKVPYSWIKEFLDIRLTPEEVAERLNLIGLETNLSKFGKYIPGLRTVKVLSINKHPQKHNLNVCRVFDGKDVFQVVTAANNIDESDVVIYANRGTELPGGVIEEVFFGDVKSEGMLISLEDIGIEEESEGVFLLDRDTDVGIDGSGILGLGEDIFEVEITPNRGDCLSVRGIVREISAAFGIPRKEPGINLNIGGYNLELEVKTDKCYRYMATVIKGINIGQSPLDIRLKLIKSGLSPINNIVDITNYLLVQEGQPLHAFDLDKIEGSLIVREAFEGEKILTLDGIERTLSEGDIVIADQVKPLAIAGVIGGENSKITEDTKNILLEVAVFDPVSIRRTSKRLGIATDSSYRFERGVDISWSEKVRDKAVYTVLSSAGGQIVGSKDIYKRVYQPKEIILSFDKLEKILGLTVDQKECLDILNSLDISSSLEDGKIKSIVPAHRYLDISRDVDIVEEIARIKGYDTFEPTFPKLSVQAFEVQKEFDFFRKTRDFMLNNGFTEVVNYTFTSPQFYHKTGLTVPPISIENYILKSQSVMRDTVVAGLIETLRENLRFGQKNLSIFEVSSCFFENHEEVRLGLLSTGRMVDGYRYNDRFTSFSTIKEWDFLSFKGVVESFLASFGLTNYELSSTQIPYLHPYISCSINMKGKTVGYLGKIHPKISEEFEVLPDVFIGELYLKYVPRDLKEDFLKEGYLYTYHINKKEPSYVELPKFPPVKRDIAFVLPANVREGDFEKDLRSSSSYISKIKLFDIYHLSEDRKSIAYSVEFISYERSFSDEEINRIVDEILHKLKLKYVDLTLRS